MDAAQPSLLTNVPALPARNRQCCAHCGQPLPRTFAHHMCKGLVSALWKLYQASGERPIRISEIGLTAGAEFNNFQKLQYFGVAGQGRRGTWRLTKDGADFLRGQLSVPKTVHTRKGRVVERSAERVVITDILPGWKWREDYAREATLA